ncbi:armadillo repeat containing 7 isoform 1 family protein [Acanthamoeba castellanii str. Neff]|uniref:Armadillo repeat containing 7 isoform 1 family protein n=1 Tax=Acanthamoeba castellanii (strain ATCC 30010 / Neff) TaxID=1257118 RepID=L8HH78_ACACF|nr:armadillo repeat containing 7 isoform 1 family protein [Acanthamoeba castellanii str. Neff]ELR24934.1 armadillo repeat containing 7 isoform 1 family protein [Acanthamoeba castellanii str. Neff]
MYRTQGQVEARHSKYSGSGGRLEYLQQLVTEYSTTADLRAKEQVLANLANFAYDPVNYDHLRRLNVVDLFLDALAEPPQQAALHEFAITGLCNLCPDPQFARLIIDNDGVPAVVGCLSSTNIETVLAAIATLYYLLSPVSKNVVGTSAVVGCMEQYAAAKNVRLHNAATLFLELNRALS